MIDKLNIENFTVFKKAEFTFSPGLNVIIGENGTGKSHLLKLGYCYLRALHDRQNDVGKPPSASMVLAITKRLYDVFKPEALENLVRRGNGKTTELRFTTRGENSEISIGANHTECLGKGLAQEVPPPLFIPPKEVLSFFYGFTSMYDLREVSIDGTYNDLCLSIGLPELRDKHREKVTPLIHELEEAIGGRIVIEEGRVYFQPTKGEKMEANLLAEGWRKIGMVALLIRTGSIATGKSVFWDEPEANLNPRQISLLAKVLVALAKNGVQIFLATHSLYLTRELVIQDTLMKNGGASPRFFALSRKKDQVNVSQGNSIEDIDPLSFLDAELEQSGRYLDLDKH
ncbi:MAG TPA: AAA family ATPase [Candidatus Ozemobacteraceae bacterium]|nr:AAA family ATPase [Candidatus Ozemobacteraceae bacterium]